MATLKELLTPPPISPVPSREPLSVITVRMPKRLHEALKEAAHIEHKSLNVWCTDALQAHAIAAAEALEVDAQHPDAIE